MHRHVLSMKTSEICVIKNASDKLTLNVLKNNAKQSSLENFFFSPLGLMQCFLMLIKFSSGQTRDEIAAVLFLKYFYHSDSIDHEFKQLIESLKKLTNCTFLSETKALVSENFSLNQIYTEFAKNYYHIEFAPVKFTNKTNIKKAVKYQLDEVKSVISEVPSKNFRRDDKMVLINALYFRGKWINQFESSETTMALFTNADKSKSKVIMMHIHGKTLPFIYQTDPSLKMIELPYEDNLSLYVLMPLLPKDLVDIVTRLDDILLNFLYESMRPEKLFNVSVPKFTLDKRQDLRETLIEFGMNEVFTENAKLNNLTKDKDIFLNSAIQHTVLVVSEEGSQIDVPPCPRVESVYSLRVYEFIVNRPFVFFIRDLSTGVTIFAGLVNNLPSLS